LNVLDSGVWVSGFRFRVQHLALQRAHLLLQLCRPPLHNLFDHEEVVSLSNRRL